MHAADFKPLPAMEYYTLALVTWMAAIDNATAATTNSSSVPMVPSCRNIFRSSGCGRLE